MSSALEQEALLAVSGEKWEVGVSSAELKELNCYSKLD